MVLVHGGQSWLYTWRFNIDTLAQHFRVLALDLPGSGYSDKPSGDHSIRALSTFLASFMDVLGLSAAAFIASSAGGVPVLDFAICHPQRTSALVLSSTCGVPHAEPALWRVMRWPLVGEVMSLFINRATVRRNLRQAFYDRDLVTEEMVTQILEPLRTRAANRAMLTMERSWDPTFVEYNLGAIKVPTLIVWGENDRWHPAAMAHEFGRHIAGAEVAVLPECGHLPHEEKPDEFNRLALHFLMGK